MAIGLSHSRYVTDFPCWMRREQMFFGFVNHGPLAYVAVQLTEAFLAECDVLNQRLPKVFSEMGASL
ncbi:hypothetical protein F2Q69_00042097 [Brassica cretica]|uniref:Uncharacterized protein n=2 Tax=Brassica cretica TaxID=69181 RepID=A0A3N6QYY6_BRACR|nr:hypothetical protein F2Q69_00042097 [Brassica cretica]KAF3564978.1 hypothetical protein DY000_02014207 [Brassica cretica]